MEGFEKQIDRLMELTAYQVKKMKEQPEKFYLLLEDPECTNVCFWYVPERLRSKNFPQAYTSDWQRELGKVTYNVRIDRLSNILCLFPQKLGSACGTVASDNRYLHFKSSHLQFY